MGEWKEYRLGDFFKVKHGYAFKGENIIAEETNNILVTPGNFHIGGGFKNDKFKYYSGDYPDEYLLKDGDIIVTMTDLSKDSDTLGYAAKVPKSDKFNYLHNQRIGLIQFTHHEVAKDFFYWLMRTREYQGYIVGSASGTSIMHTSPSRIENYVCNIPEDVKERQAIALVLTTLDDKIDLLHRQNATLEKMAETLFRQWFIEGAKEDWKEGKLGEEFDLIMGQSPDGDSFNEDELGIPMYQGNADFGFRFPVNRVFTTDPKRLAKKYDTLISVRAPVGAQNMADEQCAIGRGVAAFRYKHNVSFYSYTYYKLKSLLHKIKQFNEEGTVFGSISKLDFENLDIVIPDSKTIRDYQKKVKSLDEKIFSNTNQIHTLTQLRDTLLPKLMNGEITVR